MARYADLYARAVVSEREHHHQALAARFPGDDSLLPWDLNVDEADDAQVSSAERLSSVNCANVSSFGRQAQAAYLLDRVLSVYHGLDRIQNSAVGMSDLDRELQSFLDRVMGDGHTAHMHRAGAVAITVRCAFLSCLI